MQSLYGAIANTNKKEIMISVDTVYQKVLAIANKEQRGYITPQEFNLFADHAQKDIFRQYFYDLERLKRNPSSDVDSLIEQKIQIFRHNIGEISHGYDIPEIAHGIDVIYLHDASSEKRTYVERGLVGDAVRIKSGSLLGNLRENRIAPVYYIYNNKIFFLDSPSGNWQGASGYSYQLMIIRKPVSPNWTYVVVGESAMFDDLIPGFQDFELHPSEETLLVIKILQLAGINIKDPALVQIASQEEIKKIQQEKQ